MGKGLDKGFKAFEKKEEKLCDVLAKGKGERFKDNLKKGKVVVSGV